MALPLPAEKGAKSRTTTTCGRHLCTGRHRIFFCRCEKNPGTRLRVHEGSRPNMVSLHRQHSRPRSRRAAATRLTPDLLRLLADGCSLLSSRPPRTSGWLSRSGSGGRMRAHGQSLRAARRPIVCDRDELRRRVETGQRFAHEPLAAGRRRPLRAWRSPLKRPDPQDEWSARRGRALPGNDRSRARAAEGPIRSALLRRSERAPRQHEREANGPPTRTIRAPEWRSRSLRFGQVGRCDREPT